MVHQGPLVPGPWAYTYGVAAVLCADPRGRTNFANDVHVKGGERIIVDGCAYTVAIERRHWINLVPCE